MKFTEIKEICHLVLIKTLIIFATCDMDALARSLPSFSEVLSREWDGFSQAADWRRGGFRLYGQGFLNDFCSERRKRGIGKSGGHFMAVVAVCSDFFLKSLGSVLIILGCLGGREGFFPKMHFLSPVQLPPSMIATGLLLYLWHIWHSLQRCAHRKDDCIDRQASWICHVRHSQPSFHTPKGLRPFHGGGLTRLAGRSCQNFFQSRTGLGGYDGFSGRASVCFVKCVAVLAVVRGKHPPFASWSAWRFWRMSVFATFICFVPHQRPKTVKRTSAELRMAVLTLLKERRV